MLSGKGLEVVKEVAKSLVGRPRKALQVQDKDLGDLAAEVEVFRKKTRYEEKLEEQIKDLTEGVPGISAWRLCVARKIRE